jgi:sec-independent protein translocase protein TatA
MGLLVMGFGSVWHWIIVLTVAMVVFGAGRLPQAMTDIAKGVKAFQRGMREDGDGDGGEGAALPSPRDRGAA